MNRHERRMQSFVAATALLLTIGGGLGAARADVDDDHMRQMLWALAEDNALCAGGYDAMSQVTAQSQAAQEAFHNVANGAAITATYLVWAYGLAGRDNAIAFTKGRREVGTASWKAQWDLARTTDHVDRVARDFSEACDGLTRLRAGVVKVLLAYMYSDNRPDAATHSNNISEAVNRWLETKPGQSWMDSWLGKNPHVIETSPEGAERR